MQDFLKKIAYLIALLPIFYGACALIQFTLLRPKTRYVVIGSFAAAGVMIGLLGLLSLAAPTIQDPHSGRLLLILAAVTLLPLFKAVRWLFGRLTPLDPNSTVDISGLIALSWFIVLSGAALLTVDLAQLAGQAKITVSDAIVNVIAYPLLALSLVGVFVTRTPRESWKRLGLERLDLRRSGLALGLVIPLIVFGVVLDAAGKALQPQLYGQLQQVLQAMSFNVTNPLLAFVIGLSAGVGEEILFRGALQPRFGVWLTAVAFALAHTQYGASYAIAGVFVTGLIFGYERKYLNTTAAIITHASYDIVAFLLAYYTGTGR